MHKRKQHCAGGGERSPSVSDENRPHCGIGAHFGQTALCEVRHKYDRNDYFVSGKTENKRYQYHAVKPHQPRKRVKKIRANAEHARI